jgi:hypothetical protein
MIPNNTPSFKCFRKRTQEAVLLSAPCTGVAVGNVTQKSRSLFVHIIKVILLTKGYISDIIVTGKCFNAQKL